MAGAGGCACPSASRCCGCVPWVAVQGWGLGVGFRSGVLGWGLGFRVEVGVSGVGFRAWVWFESWLVEPAKRDSRLSAKGVLLIELDPKEQQECR